MKDESSVYDLIEAVIYGIVSKIIQKDNIVINDGSCYNYSYSNNDLKNHKQREMEEEKEIIPSYNNNQKNNENTELLAHCQAFLLFNGVISVGFCFVCVFLCLFFVCFCFFAFGFCFFSLCVLFFVCV